MDLKQFVLHIWGKLFQKEPEEEETLLDLQGFEPITPSKQVQLNIDPEVSLSEFLFKTRVREIDLIGMDDYKDYLIYEMVVSDQFPQNHDLYIVQIPGTQKATLLFLPEGESELVGDPSVVAIPLSSEGINEMLKELILTQVEQKVDTNLSDTIPAHDMFLVDLYKHLGEERDEVLEQVIDQTVSIFAEVPKDWQEFYKRRISTYTEIAPPKTIELLNNLSPSDLKDFLEKTVAPDFLQVLNRTIERTNEEDRTRAIAFNRNFKRERDSSGPSL